MIFTTTAVLHEFRGLGNFATFTVSHESDDRKHYYCQFFIDAKKYKDFRFVEGRDYELTLSVTQAKRITGTNKSIKLERSAIFLHNIKEASETRKRGYGYDYGDCRLNLIVLEKRYMEDKENLGVHRLKVCDINDKEQEYPFYIWDYARYDHYADLAVYTEKYPYKYSFLCFLFNKTHYDNAGKPSTESCELLDNGKNKWYTELKIRTYDSYKPRKTNSSKFKPKSN